MGSYCRRLFLPPYSPDLNPIEQLFATLQALPQPPHAATRDALQNAIGTALDTFTADERRNDIASCRPSHP